jgi:tetratricopeptide (TPR) repeat protein
MLKSLFQQRPFFWQWHFNSLLTLICLWGLQSCSQLGNAELEGDFDNTKFLKGDIKTYEGILVTDPGNELALEALGWLQVQNGHLDGAINHFNRCLRINGRNASAYMGLGLAYRRAGNFEYAARSYEQAVKLRNSWLNAYYQLAEVYNLMGDIKNARVQMHKIAQKDTVLARKLMDVLY